jgi:hypothetical protein
MNSEDMRGEHLNLAREVIQQLDHIQVSELESLSTKELKSLSALCDHWRDLSDQLQLRRREITQ